MRPGSSAARAQWQARARMLSRRVQSIIRDEGTGMGNRPGVAAIFGFGDARGWDGTPERFRYLAHRWLAPA